ncbi:MAG: histidine phosphatase family protein, partial [Gammaproteobacteria bacterium]|nr:histidine phosphatase family protein [Gammaproteobacteria bacterium]
VGYLRTQEEFEQRVAHLFACPGQTVFGRESADEAHARFSRAVSDALAQYPGENVAIATHGTVMALFVARAAGLDPFEFWKQLTMPSLVVMRLPGFELEAVHVGIGRAG